VARIILPPALFLAASPYFLPKTSHNVRQYFARIEDAHFPEIAKQHDELVRSLSSTFQSAVSRAEGLGVDVKSISGKVVRQVEDTTGLRLGEVLGRAQEIEQNVAREIERERHARETSVEGGKGEVIGVVMEATPVAQIVVPPGSTEAEVVPEDSKSELVPAETEPSVAPVDSEPSLAPVDTQPAVVSTEETDVKAVPVATDEKIVEKTEVESKEKPAARLV
jgi:organizing structure protein 2